MKLLSEVELLNLIEAEEAILPKIAYTRSAIPVPDHFRWEMVARGDGTVNIIPLRLPRYLYRGQNMLYSPCLPSVARGFGVERFRLDELTAEELSELILRFVQCNWFVKALRQHPMAEWAHGQKVFINEVGIAQHYGLPTGYVDLTSSLKVAAFFAVTEFKEGRWLPMTKGEGFIYRVDNHRFSINERRPFAIGFQPLPRPTEQHAWVMELLLGENFEHMPWLQRIRFAHSKALSEKVLGWFSGGEKLFPSDPLAEVADRVLRAKVVPESILRETTEDLVADSQGLPGRSVDDVIREVKASWEKRHEKITAIENIEQILRKEDAELAERLWSARKDDFFTGVTFTLVRTEKGEHEG